MPDEIGRPMEKIVERGLLYDFYGELLTMHQREVYAELIEQDLSLAELAEEFEITRQGAHDLIKRCDKLLFGYEEKLHLLERFLKMRDQITKTQQVLGSYRDTKDEALLDEALQILDDLSEEI